MSELYADVIVDISHGNVDRPFQYRIPEKLVRELETGMCVKVPFGAGNKPVRGYVTDITPECRFDRDRMKAVQEIVREGVGAQNSQICLAGWIRRNYGGTMIQALRTVLPVKKSVRGNLKRTVILAAGREEAVSVLGECQRKHQTARARLLRELLKEGSIPYSLVTEKLMVGAASLRSLESAGVIRVESTLRYRNPVVRGDLEQGQKTLSGEQSRVVEAILEDFDAGRRETYLIHGITGSGKTEVYIRLAEQIVARGRQAIVLIPEIALTYQTLMRFYRRFGDRVSVMNSTLSQGEKYDQCERARRGEIDVIIGPRSALFTPFSRIGLIVMDEEHEGSYKSENTPKYHARETAIELARMQGASVVLGSATPSLESYYRVGRGEYKLFRLTSRLTGGTLPQVHTVDLRRELWEGNRSIFSRKLQELLADRLRRGQQSMLFLNRRGFAGFVSCRACGHVMKCPHCDVSLSEHRNGRLVCHYCGYESPRVKICPKCASPYISGFRAGTEQIEDRLKDLLPGVRILRMDADTTRTKDSYERILAAFGNGEADVLVGTQMIVKGHDFPGVTLVGVLAADLSLCAGDYRAAERTFQLLTQAAGRAGRGAWPGEVVIQTYQPDHYAVRHAAAQDYEGFYREEILFREMMGYPPVLHMLAVQVFAQKEQEGMEAARALAGALAAENGQGQAGLSRSLPGPGELQVIGPAPGNLSRIKDTFRFAFYVKHGDYGRLVAVKDALEQAFAAMETPGLSLQFDFDPMTVL